MSKKLKVMFSTHGLVEGDYGYQLDEKGYPDENVIIQKNVITGTDTGGQVYYVKALASIQDDDYDINLVTRRVDSRICKEFGGTPKDLGNDINYTVEKQWHMVNGQKSLVLRVPAGGHFGFIPKESIVPVLPELVDNLVDYYEKQNMLKEIAVVEGHYRDGMLAADILCGKIEEKYGYRPVMLVTSHSLGHKKYERNLPKYQNGEISEEEWNWHNFQARINHETFAFNKADIIIATSPDEQRRLGTEPYNVDLNKVTVIPPGYNNEVFTPYAETKRAEMRRNFSYRDMDGQIRSFDLTGKKIVSSLGRVVRDKGFVELSRTMSELMKDNASLVYMVSSEKGNPVTAECEEILKKVRNNVIFLPSLKQNEMADIYNLSDVFVMSSLNEAFGMVPIEAMGCKTAVVVGRSGFNDFAHCADVRSEDADFSKAIGLYAPSQEEDRYRQIKAISMLLNNDHLREQIAQNGYNYVTANLTWQQISNQKNNLIKNVIRQRNIQKFNNKIIIDNKRSY